MEWSKNKYNEYYNHYMPWIEDKYLNWYGENKTSYTAKEQLKGNKISGDKNLNAVQDGVADGVGGQFASGGLLGGVGDAVSKEGINRTERGEPQEQGKTWTDSATGAGQSVAGGASSLTGGMLGGGGDDKGKGKK